VRRRKKARPGGQTEAGGVSGKLDPILQLRQAERNAIKVPCDRCGALPGEPCTKIVQRHLHRNPLGSEKDEPHTPRVRLAAHMAGGAE